LHLTLLATALPVFLVSLTLAGCGGKKDDDDIPPRKGKVTGTGPGPAKAKLKPVAGKYEGVIKGKVVWAGAKPNFDDLTTKLRAAIQKDRDYCLSGKEYETNQQVYRIGENGNLGNVYVWIVPDKGHYFEVPEAQIKALPQEVRISQPHCAFMPHCSIHVPAYMKGGELTPTGQKLVVENDAKMVSHNAKVGGGPDNPEQDRILAPGNSSQYPLKPSRNYVTISCGVHPWMKGYIRVFDHPYAALTSVGGDIKKKEYEDMKDPKVGTYEIKGVPVGAKVRIVAWHEELGFLTPAAGEEITLQADNTKDFEAKMK
jgi:hypothetical protein